MLQVSAGGGHSLALTEGGHVLSWGCGYNCCLGHGDEENQPLPKLIEALRGKNVLHISAGGEHSLALTEGGHVLSWGAEGNGQLGHGDMQHQLLPKPVAALKDVQVVDIAAGPYHSVVRLELGELRRTNENAPDGWACLPPAAN